MNIIKKTSICVALSLLLGCNDSSSSSNEVEVVQEIPIVNETFETTNVSFQFNLPSGSALLNTENFTFDDLLTSNARIGTIVCDPSGAQMDLELDFVHTEPNKWDVYFKLKDEFLNIDGGEIGGTGQNKATLSFDENGNFIRQYPYVLNSTDIELSGKTYRIQFDFYSDPTTNLNENFTALNLNANGC
jgi:hypothetical protein